MAKIPWIEASTEELEFSDYGRWTGAKLYAAWVIIVALIVSFWTILLIVII